jgi:hypothetical protein
MAGMKNVKAPVGEDNFPPCGLEFASFLCNGIKEGNHKRLLRRNGGATWVWHQS